MRRHGSLEKDEEVNKAAWEAARGALTGAARWGIYAGVLGAAAYAFSPIYRGLTIQFKVYLQMSGMAVGSMIEADRRMLAYERKIRAEKRIARDAEVWKRYKMDFEESAAQRGGREGAAAKGKE
ncbi:hypothetical protein W97_05830 [Coniosporium apollinis CBS 100218]|uniref:Imidazoleglycerol-phosphate dehydratase n=1 Tax=Coniosporium apollinis (strain CBS 100218) TaxID=1168221 RepID=R7YXT9_CONA1|nr:uncharacterized protein W97_05830 [Coniosporium apollinis CBS 100218]EON66584.1 hypothetical protein W97_05830 [Coniosporium apollinis CBS 100218]